jgi:hypothetical protein
MSTIGYGISHKNTKHTDNFTWLRTKCGEIEVNLQEFYLNKYHVRGNEGKSPGILLNKHQVWGIKVNLQEFYWTSPKCGGMQVNLQEFYLNKK